MQIFSNKITRNKKGEARTSISGAENTEVGPPAQYGGSPDTLNPEEMFVASVNSCLMLVFFHFAEKKGLDVTSYNSSADGKVEKTKNGLRFTEVEVPAEIEVGDTDRDKVQQAAELAEKFCLISNSVNCPVDYQVNVID